MKVARHNGLWDRMGIFVSALCVVHCLLIPGLLIFFPLLGKQLIPQEDITHAVMFAFISGLASWSFVSGFRVHGQIRPVLLMGVGISIIFYATFFAHQQLGHVWEPIIAIIGSLALIRAHFLNHNHCRVCEEDGVATAALVPTDPCCDHDSDHNHGHSHDHGSDHDHGHHARTQKES